MCAHTQFILLLLQMNIIVFAPNLMLSLFSQGQGLTHTGKEPDRIRDLFL